MTTVVNGTPSIDSVMLGAFEPSVALARTTRPVDAGIDTVVDAVPADVSASAFPPEALVSETIRPEPDDARVMVSSSTDVVVGIATAVAVLVALVAVVAALAVAVGCTGTVTAANLSRRLSTRPTAARASAGAGGVLSELVPDVVGADSLAGVMDWVTGVAGARRLVAAGAVFFRD